MRSLTGLIGYNCKMASVNHNSIVACSALLACGAGLTALAYLFGDGSAQSWLICSWLTGCTVIVGLYTFNWKQTLRINGFYGVQSQEAALSRSGTTNPSIVARWGAAGGGGLGASTILVASLATGLPQGTVVLCMISLLAGLLLPIGLLGSIMNVATWWRWR